jgi:putative MFS transporter
MNAPTASRMRQILQPAVIVGALGYFVDIYDLVLFTIVRTPSLMALGLRGDELTGKGLLLLNLQMAGMLIGGIFWGILGDKKGRRLLLFGSIALYSTATLANGFVSSLPAYGFWRVLAGIGLAGELGGSMALVSEQLPKELRGYGTMIVASVGVAGAVVASLVADLFDWRTAYFVGGGLGFMLLTLRVSVSESGMFEQMRVRADVARGNFLSLFTSMDRFSRYACCVLIGAPLWYAVGIVVTLCPEFAKALHIQGEVTGSRGILFVYSGLVVGDFASGFLSQIWRSRKKAVLLGLTITIIFLCLYFSADGRSAMAFYAIIFCLGLGIGYWAVFATIAAEQFGTNLRATVATTVPNFARAALIPITLLFTALRDHFGLLTGGFVTGMICVGIALLALFRLRETYGADLDYVEVS